MWPVFSTRSFLSKKDSSTPSTTTSTSASLSSLSPAKSLGSPGGGHPSTPSTIASTSSLSPAKSLESPGGELPLTPPSTSAIFTGRSPPTRPRHRSGLGRRPPNWPKAHMIRAPVLDTEFRARIGDNVPLTDAHFEWLYGYEFDRELSYRWTGPYTVYDGRITENVPYGFGILTNLSFPDQTRLVWAGAESSWGRDERTVIKRRYGYGDIDHNSWTHGIKYVHVAKNGSIAYTAGGKRWSLQALESEPAALEKNQYLLRGFSGGLLHYLLPESRISQYYLVTVTDLKPWLEWLLSKVKPRKTRGGRRGRSRKDRRTRRRKNPREKRRGGGDRRYVLR